MSGHQHRMSVGFVGSPAGMTDDQLVQLRWLVLQIDPTELHHGDGLGADVQFHAIASSLGVPTILHPSTDTRGRGFSQPFTRRFEPRISDDRNRDIANDSMILIAATDGSKADGNRSETWDVVRQARRVGGLIVLIHPDGVWELEKCNTTSNDAAC